MSTTTELRAATPATPVRRMSRDQRREQLLDVASTLVVAQGIGALTMERLAAWAGVSKALPYQHFSDADDVLVAIHDREVVLLASRVSGALDRRHSDDDAVDVLVTTYFDAVEDRGEILALVATAGSPVARLADRDPFAAHAFSTALLVEHLGVSPTAAGSAAGFVTGALVGAVQSVGDGVADRAAVERTTVDVLRAGLAAIGARDG